MNVEGIREVSKSYVTLTNFRRLHGRRFPCSHIMPLSLPHSTCVFRKAPDQDSEMFIQSKESS